MMTLPNSTGPPALGEEQGKGKRKRRHTKRYNEAVEEGILDPSQTVHSQGQGQQQQHHQVDSDEEIL
jgi:hypothetical protein